MRSNEGFKDLSFRNKLIYSTVIVAFVLGWIITFLGFYAPPKGEVDNTVIVIFGQALTYCAYGLGIKEYGDYIIHKSRMEQRNEKDNREDTDE